MPADVVVPTLGLGRSSGHIAEWYVPDGATVQCGELVYRYERDYVAFDVEAESDGTLHHRLETGERPLQGAVVGVICSPGEEELSEAEPHWQLPGHEPVHIASRSLGALREPGGPAGAESPSGRLGDSEEGRPPDSGPHAPAEGQSVARLFNWKRRRDERPSESPDLAASRLGWITGNDAEEGSGRWPGDAPHGDGDRGAFSWPQLDIEDARPAGGRHLGPHPGVEPSRPAESREELPLASGRDVAPVAPWSLSEDPHSQPAPEPSVLGQPSDAPAELTPQAQPVAPVVPSANGTAVAAAQSPEASKASPREGGPEASALAGRLGWITADEDEDAQAERPSAAFGWNRAVAQPRKSNPEVPGTAHEASADVRVPEDRALDPAPSGWSAEPAESWDPAATPAAHAAAHAADEDAELLPELDAELAGELPQPPEPAIEDNEEDVWWEREEPAPSASPERAPVPLSALAAVLPDDAIPADRDLEAEDAAPSVIADDATAFGDDRTDLMGQSSFRVEVNLREAERVRAAESGPAVADQPVILADLVLKAVAITVAECWGTAGDEGIALVRPQRAGDEICMVHGAARRPLAKISAARIVSEPAEGEGRCACVLFLLDSCGLDEGAPLPAGHAFAFSMGRVRDAVAFEGRSILSVPVATLTVAFRPGTLPLGEAAWMLGRIRELVEQPAALIAEWQPLH